MGGGGGGPTTNYTSGYSGQGGGRIIPGTSENRVPWSLVNGVTGSATTVLQDNRYNTTSLYYFAAEGFGAPPSSAGQAGRGSSYVAFQYNGSGTIVTVNSQAGAGGGWGAQGGTASVAGGAAGKAINTAGNTVTWIGGSSRVYGVVG